MGKSLWQKENINIINKINECCFVRANLSLILGNIIIVCPSSKDNKKLDDGMKAENRCGLINKLFITVKKKDIHLNNINSSASVFVCQLEINKKVSSEVN